MLNSTSSLALSSAKMAQLFQQVKGFCHHTGALRTNTHTETYKNLSFTSKILQWTPGASSTHAHMWSSMTAPPWQQGVHGILGMTSG